MSSPPDEVLSVASINVKESSAGAIGIISDIEGLELTTLIGSPTYALNALVPQSEILKTELVTMCMYLQHAVAI